MVIREERAGVHAVKVFRCLQLPLGALVVVCQRNTRGKVVLAVLALHTQGIGHILTLLRRIRHELVEHNPVEGKDTRHMVHGTVLLHLAVFLLHPSLL